MKNLRLLLPIFLLLSCATQNNNTTEKKSETLWVNSLIVPCTRVAPMNCLQVQKGKTLKDNGWEFFYDNIKGFDYQAGYIYKLLVNIEELKPGNIPADASSLK
ncbi:MAG: heat shock protein HslJ [Paraglaciecola sp.]|jgi:heat shock protein HslJ